MRKDPVFHPFKLFLNYIITYLPLLLGDNLTMKQTRKDAFSIVLIIITFVLVTQVNAQSTSPAVFLSQTEMTPSGGQPYDEFYWLNSNNASLTKNGVNFPSTGSYRCDISAYLDEGTPMISVSIDGTSKGNISITSTSIGIFSLLISSIPAGTHTVTLKLINFNSAANYGKVGLVYFTRTSESLPYVYPSISSLSFTPAVTMLTANHFGSGHLRGFCLGGNGYNQTDADGGDVQSMMDMVATGANIARCFVVIERPSGDTYQFKAGELEKLDSTVARGKRLGFYVVPVLFHDPSLNTDYWGNAARKLSIVKLWKTLASKYKGNPAIGGYDLINEPRQNFNYAEVIRFEEQMIDTIRTIDASHVVMVECVDNDMFAMMLPLYQYSDVVYSPHGYSSLMITHQGVPGEPEANVRNKYPTLTSTSNLKASWGKTQLSAQHEDVRIMTHRFHVPIFIGEFSCINWAPKNDAGEWSSTKWCDDNISLLETEKWSWCYHAWRGDWPGWEAEIPSSYYTQFSFANAKPQGLPSYSEWIKNRTSSAPTIVMLKKWFALNAQTDSSTSSPSVIINDVDVAVAPGTATLSVKLSNTSSKTITVAYTTQDGVAKSTKNYKAISGTLKIPAGSLKGTIKVSIIKQGYYSKYFFLKLSNPKNATIKDNTGKVTIMGTSTLTNSAASIQNSDATDITLTAKAQPNPSSNYFNLSAQSKNSEPLIIKIMDLSGRVLELKNGVIPNNSLQLGYNLKAGIYIAEVTQGKEKVQLKIVKL